MKLTERKVIRHEFIKKERMGQIGKRLNKKRSQNLKDWTI
jgi:hypothetical protein